MFTFGSSDDDDDDDDRSDNKSSSAFFIKTWGKGLGTRETWQTFTFMYTTAVKNVTAFKTNGQGGGCFSLLQLLSS